MILKGKVQHNNNNNNNNNGQISAQGGVEKHQFQQWTSTHSGTGEKETLNINVVGKSKISKNEIMWNIESFENYQRVTQNK